ncbi:TPA: hypothetical protein PXJ50_004395 [Yersinia enterocolitica]|nr:hypothetical protein [Yersinia enterocolitica]HDL6597957.1 hypothetical protein [Yersinia enterocolitica]HDL6670909.1 hypothetical protein [Yersinia enterocolitica]HDL6726746.1 hypothetical protein [Yersinia enterocolitica]HDL6735848.1 hypothetical protein [Yersinia enterocolitica]
MKPKQNMLLNALKFIAFSLLLASVSAVGILAMLAIEMAYHLRCLTDRIRASK